MFDALRPDEKLRRDAIAAMYLYKKRKIGQPMDLAAKDASEILERQCAVKRRCQSQNMFLESVGPKIAMTITDSDKKVTKGLKSSTSKLNWRHLLR